MLTVHYGGTFDPIHNGHLAIARGARDVLQAPVALLPAADPPHRPAPGASAAQRARMLELALAGEPGLGIDLRELARPGPSYTVDTLRDLRQAHGPDAPMAWLIGEDSLRTLDRWHRWTELFDLAHLVVAARAGGTLESAVPAPVAAALAARWAWSPRRLGEVPAGCILLLEQPLRGESASAVREARAQGGQGWRADVPAAVAAFIDSEGLYLDTASTPVRYNPRPSTRSIECPLSNQAHVIKTRLPDPAPPVDQLLAHVRQAVEELKGKDAVEINVRGKTSVADHLVIVSGTSTRHVKSIADEVVKFAKKLGAMPLGVEGEREAEWVLVDLGDVIVHVMLPRVREFYALERLWTVGDQPSRDDE